MKTLSASLQLKIDRPYVEPVYIVQMSSAEDALFFSDRTLVYSGNNYEEFITGFSRVSSRIDHFGGYPNLSLQLHFDNPPFKDHSSLLDYFESHPVTGRSGTIRVLYKDINGGIPAEDTVLHNFICGEIRNVKKAGFDLDLHSILHWLDNKNIFLQINRTDFPNAAPSAVGQYVHDIYGDVSNVPCHCIDTGASSPLFADLTASATTVYVSDADWPMTFPANGTVQIDNEQISYAGRTGNSLTGCTRGANSTTAAVHGRGAPVWVVKTSYKYLVARHICKAVDNVKIQGIRVDAADYTVNLNDSGKTTIAFTAKPLLKIQGSHAHTSPSKVKFIPTGSATTKDSIYTEVGTNANMRDQSDVTYDGVTWTSSVTAGVAILKVTFPAWTGSAPIRIYAGLQHSITLIGAYAKFQYSLDGTNFSDIADLATTQKASQIFLISGLTTVPAALRVYISNWPGAVGNKDHYNYEMWLEVESTSTSSSAAEGVWGNPTDVVAPEVTCDVQGYADDGSGTYTGSANALIENPSDVRKHFLMAILGRSSSEIGSTFGDMRTTYTNRITGGYKFATILSHLGNKPSEILKTMDYNSRSNLREDGGKFELTFNDTADPTTSLAVDETNKMADPEFEQTALMEIRNKIRAVYNKDFGGSQGKKTARFGGNYLAQVERSNAASITKYGELAEDLEFPAIAIEDMAEDVADFILLQKKDVLKKVSVLTDWSARALERSDYVLLTHAFWSGLKWKVLSIEERAQKEHQFLIEAVQFVAS